MPTIRVSAVKPLALVAAQIAALPPVSAGSAGATARVRILDYSTQGETSVVGSAAEDNRRGGTSLPDRATTFGNFQIEELPRELRTGGIGLASPEDPA